MQRSKTPILYKQVSWEYVLRWVLAPITALQIYCFIVGFITFNHTCLITAIILSVVIFTGEKHVRDYHNNHTQPTQSFIMSKKRCNELTVTQTTSRSGSSITQQHRPSSTDNTSSGWNPSEALPENTSVRTIPAYNSSQRPLTCENPCEDCYRKPIKEIKWQSHNDTAVTHQHWVCKPCYNTIRSK